MSILTATRASAAHLATAQRHAGAAARARGETKRLLASISAAETYAATYDASARRSVLADYRERAARLIAEAERAERLAQAAMARHEKAGAKLG